MKASMSRKVKCYENAPIESFWGALKNELIRHRYYESRKQAIQNITEYIVIFYNRKMGHKRLGCLSPVTYEKNYYKKLLIA